MFFFPITSHLFQWYVIFLFLLLFLFCIIYIMLFIILFHFSNVKVMVYLFFSEIAVAKKNIEIPKV